MKTKIYSILIILFLLVGSTLHAKTEFEFHRVIMRTETRVGLGGAVYVENVVYLLLKDGSCRVDPVANPYHWNVKKDKSQQPKKWSNMIYGSSNTHSSGCRTAAKLQHMRGQT